MQRCSFLVCFFLALGATSWAQGDQKIADEQDDFELVQMRRLKFDTSITNEEPMSVNSEAQPTYDKVSGQSCGWGGGCGPSDQAFIYPFKGKIYGGLQDGKAKVKPNVDRSVADQTCGAICSESATCMGFTWIASLNGINNGCWFRKRTDCGENKDINRDCFKKVVRPSPRPSPSPSPSPGPVCDETLRGTNGADYRGCQNKAINGRTCQKWTALSPGLRQSYSAYSTNGLGDHNYCRNPDGYATIYCYTLIDGIDRWQSCRPAVKDMCPDSPPDCKSYVGFGWCADWKDWMESEGCACDCRALEASSLLQNDQQSPNSVSEAQPTYDKVSGQSCGWGGGCGPGDQAFIYPFKGNIYGGLQGGKAKVMPNVDRSKAEQTCGAICKESATCMGFNWIASLHGVKNGCWFRKRTDCGEKKDRNRDCFKKAFSLLQNDQQSSNSVLEAQPTYDKVSGRSCGWGGGCGPGDQAFIYPFQGKIYGGLQGGKAKVKPNVDRSEADQICGAICSESATCMGFTWIASLHGVKNGCWFRKRTDCGENKDRNRDCFKKASTPEPKPEAKVVRPSPRPSPSPSPSPGPAQPTYDKVSGQSCGWGGGCGPGDQAFIYPFQGNIYGGLQDGKAKVKPNVDRSEADQICGAICSESATCMGFTWIASLHGITNGCWFRKRTDCGENKDINRDCFKKASSLLQNDYQSSNFVSEA